MPLHPFRQFDTPDFRLLYAITERLDGRPVADAGVLDALALLAEAYDPRRADRLRPRPGEPAAIVERLAAIFLSRVPAEVVPQAQRLLDDPGRTGSARVGEPSMASSLSHEDLAPCA